MRKLALVLVFLGFGCAAAALALKAFAPGEKGAVALSAGDTVNWTGRRCRWLLTGGAEAGGRRFLRL